MKKHIFINRKESEKSQKNHEVIISTFSLTASTELVKKLVSELQLFDKFVFYIEE